MKQKKRQKSGRSSRHANRNADRGSPQRGNSSPQGGRSSSRSSSRGGGRHGGRSARGKGQEVTGTFTGTRHGYGFVSVAGREEDVFVPAPFVAGAVTGDEVRILLEDSPPSRGNQRRGPIGKVQQIVERRHEEIVGVLRREEGFRGKAQWHLEPRVEGFPNVRIIGTEKRTAEDGPPLQEGDLVNVRIKKFAAERGELPLGELSQWIGPSGDPAAEERATVLKFHLRESFPEPVQREAEKHGTSIPDAEIAKRRDLRKELFFTIDGDKARDFDDAVCLRVEGANIRLFVAIADVAHYVRPGSHLDLEAYLRATSVYFPTRAIHMLPSGLSAGLCSLVPHEDRLALVAEMTFDGQGRRLTTDLYEAVFQSHARLTYSEVAEVLRTGAFAPNEPRISPIRDEGLRKRVCTAIGEMKVLFERLAAVRRKRGSLDFDLPEAEFVFEDSADPYAIGSILRGSRLDSHRLIEEFMIAANEAVAEFITEREIPMPYRIHETPDPIKIQDFLALIEKIPEFQEGRKALEMDGQAWTAPGFLARIMNELRDLPAASTLHQLLLQSLKLASYSPTNKGHFGLASQCYAHFTSPIRRYPDLMLHRIVKAFLKKEPGAALYAKLPEGCTHCSKQEQIAVGAEREVVAFYKARFMRDRLGENFKGVIVKVTTNGFFVELEEIFVDGYVPIELLPEDDYAFQQDKQRLSGKRHQFSQGQEIDVQVAAVDLDRRRITFSWPQGAEAPRGTSPAQSRRQKSRSR